MAAILIVDERPTNREYLASLLSDGGHRLFEAADGEEALALAGRDRPDLIIANILMPKMNGNEFVRQLRADSTLAHTQVIFSTSNNHMQEASALAKKCSVAGILIEPCEAEFVLRAVETALSGIPTPMASAPTVASTFDRENLRLFNDKLSEQAEELRRTNERLTAIVELSLKLGSERDPEQLLQGFANAAREIIGASYAIVGIANVEQDRLLHFFTSGMDAATVGRLGFPTPNQGTLGQLLKSAYSLSGRNPGGDPVAAGFGKEFPPINSWVGAPIRSLTINYGWVVLIDKIGADAFLEDEERLVGILAAQVGRIYENSSLFNTVLSQSAELRLKVNERGRAEKRFRDLIESAPDAMIIIDGEELITIANERTEKLFGYSRAELLGQPVEMLVPERYHDQSVAARQPYLSNPNLSPPGEVIEQVGRRKDGSEFPIEINLSPLQTDEGIVVTIVIRNITERKKTETALQNMQKRLEHVISSNPAVIFTLAVESERIRKVSWISENVRTMLGYAPDETMAENWWFEKIHPEDRPRVRDHIHRSLSAQGHAIEEHRFQHKKGHYRWVQNEMRLLRDAEGQPFEVVGSWSDITERKQLEDQILQAQKMEAVGKLAGGIAHDFNNLLTVINGYCEILIAGLDPDSRIREPLEEIHNAGERAAALTRQLLAFSRKAVLAPVVLDLNDLLRNLHKMLARLIGEDIELKVVLNPTIWKVKVDPGQMEQVILNLVVNARDAMPQGGKLTIEIANIALDEDYANRHPETQQGFYVQIAVSDTGSGMDAATQARIFEPFFTTKGPDQGTGLGLSVVHGIVKQSGGRVEVYSELGLGTTFKIYLPRTEDEAPVSRIISKKPSRRGSETVLLVEDETGVRLLARMILQRQGYNVLDAKNGEEALQLSMNHPGHIDILVTDTIMPRMSGLQLAQQLTKARPKMKVLFLSGYTDDAIVHHGIIDSDIPFLQKPFSSEGLANKVRDLLDG